MELAGADPSLGRDHLCGGGDGLFHQERPFVPGFLARPHSRQAASRPPEAQAPLAPVLPRRQALGRRSKQAEVVFERARWPPVRCSSCGA